MRTNIIKVGGIIRKALSANLAGRPVSLDDAEFDEVNVLVVLEALLVSRLVIAVLTLEMRRGLRVRLGLLNLNVDLVVVLLVT